MVLHHFGGPLGIIFVTFWWSLALVKTVSPPARELCFECFEASETGLFLASLFTAVLGNTLRAPGCLLGSTWIPIGATLGTMGRGEREPVGPDGLARERKYIYLPCSLVALYHIALIY